MDNQFLAVKTWQGYVMVSASLLPNLAEEQARIYSHCNTYELGWQDMTQSNSKVLHTATPWPPMPCFSGHEAIIKHEHGLDAIHHIGNYFAYSLDTALPRYEPTQQLLFVIL